MLFRFGFQAEKIAKSAGVWYAMPEVRSYIVGGTICYGHRRANAMRSHIIGGTISY